MALTVCQAKLGISIISPCNKTRALLTQHEQQSSGIITDHCWDLPECILKTVYQLPVHDDSF